MPPKIIRKKKVKEDLIDPFVEKELLYNSLKIINNKDILDNSKRKFYFRKYLLNKILSSSLEENRKNIYIKLLENLNFLSNHKDIEKSKITGNAIIYRTTHIGQMKNNYPVGISISKSDIEPIYFSTSTDYVKPYLNMSPNKSHMKIYRYELSDVFEEQNMINYYLFIDFNKNDSEIFDIEFLKDIYLYIFKTYQLLNNNNQFVKLPNADNYGLGIVSETKKLYMSIFGCSNNLNSEDIGKKCSIHGIDKMVAIQFNKLFKEFEDYCNLQLREINKKINILGYYHGKVLTTDPQFKYFHPELIIQTRFLTKQEREKYLFK
jgi:hypothetical protein